MSIYRKLFIPFLMLFMSIPLSACGGNASSSQSISVGLQKIEVSENAKKNYLVNESFVRPEVYAYYGDGSNKEVSISCDFSGFSSKTTGSKTVEVSYTELDITKTTSYTINVSEVPVTLLRIEISSDAKTSYEYEEEFVKPTVTAFYDNSTSKVVTNDVIFSGFDSTIPGNQEITATYTENQITKTDSYTVNIKPAPHTLSKIEVASDAKKEYDYGTNFVKPSVTATFSDSSTAEVGTHINTVYSGFNSFESGKQTITVSYTYAGVTKTDSYEVTIKQATKVLSSIKIESTTQKEFSINDEFVNPIVTAIFTDETTQDVSALCTSTGYDMSKGGEQTVTTSFTYAGVTKSTTYQINIKESLLRYAIFADVQLCGNSVITNESVINQGSTANAPLALESHLRFCKKENISTILMNGDITNQANEYYYQFFESIVKKVYGNDKSTWPEFVYNMGNHEWWWGVTEKETGDAVSMFRKYARINSENLVAESEVPYRLNNKVNVPSYYKVINGIPFIVVSGESSDGDIGNVLKAEVESWRDQAKQLDSVKAGGPIFVEYHCALSTTMTHGQGAGKYCSTIENIFKDTPNAVIFTGDTHYPGINERAVNQVDFTTINLGSSSYSRMVNTSATEITDNYDNVKGTGAKTADKLYGNAKYCEAYTPTIQVIDVKPNYSYTIDRYFSTDDGNGEHVGNQLLINPIKSKSDFKFTNDRFVNTKSANELYGKDGLDWKNSDEVVFGVANNRATVKFPDVIDYHYCEHYLIEINGKKYDEVSNYFKNLSQPGYNYYTLENVPSAQSYTVKVTAYDFFDNPSTNTLTSTNNDINQCIDDVDFCSTTTYCDIQTRNRVDIVSPNKDYKGNSSKSSLEFYYKGIYNYNYGAILNNLYVKDGQGCNDYLSLTDASDIEPTVTCDIKNLGSGSLTIGLTLVNSEGKWLSDFSSNTQKTVSGNEWTNVIWNLTDFGITSKADLSTVKFKVKSSNSSSSGYEMNFLLDNIDICDHNPHPEKRGMEFKTSTNFSVDLTGSDIKTIATDNMVIDIRFDSTADTYVELMLGNGWSNYFGYYKIYANGQLADTYNGISVTHLEDGFYRYIFDLDKLTKKTGDPGEKINLFFISGNKSNASGAVDLKPKI